MIVGSSVKIILGLSVKSMIRMTVGSSLNNDLRIVGNLKYIEPWVECWILSKLGQKTKSHKNFAISKVCNPYQHKR